MKRTLILSNNNEELTDIDDFDLTSRSFQLLEQNLVKLKKTKLKLIDDINEFPEIQLNNTDSSNINDNINNNIISSFIYSNTFWNELIIMTKEIIPYDNNCGIDDKTLIDNNNVNNNLSSISSDLSNFHDENEIDLFKNIKLTYKNDALVITESKSPFKIKYVNETWSKLCGYTIDECLDKTLSIIQGPDTDKKILNDMMIQVDSGINCSARLVNYHKNGTPFYNKLNISHLKDESNNITHCIGILKFDGYHNDFHNCGIMV